MNEETENIAATLARILPQVSITGCSVGPGIPSVLQIAVPKTMELKEIDLERLLPNPRRTIAVAKFSDADSFIKYVATHRQAGSTVWCDFNPQTFDLSFAAVIDEHVPGAAGWRSHRASFKPDMSAEWKAWKARNAQQFGQTDFAEWIEEHAEDIATANGLPTSLEMLRMATDFHANEERVLKSSIKLQSGGVRLTYIADPTTGTTEAMQMFEKFAIGIPVFQAGAPWSITARLKYRMKAGAVFFHYELVRPDRVHQGAAAELIDQVRLAIGDVPLLMGAIA